MRSPSRTISAARRALIAGAASVVALGLTSCQVSEPSPSPDATTAPVTQWSYSGSTGPEHWGQFGAACENIATSHESPINISTDALIPAPASEAVVPDYHDATFDVENTGRTIEAIPADPAANAVTLHGTRYILQQFHFHATSEHLVDGNSHAAELHLVHKAADGSLLVVGVFLDQGEADAELAELLRSVPAVDSNDATRLTETIDPSALLPDARASVQYDGSLTTPPCSEGVQWNVFLTPVTVSAEQLHTLTTAYPDNHRPVQPLHGRPLTLVDDGTGVH